MNGELDVTVVIPYDDIVRFRSGLMAVARAARNTGMIEAVGDVDDLSDLISDACDTQLAGLPSVVIREGGLADPAPSLGWRRR